MEQRVSKFSCDNCGKKLPTCHNSLNIVTSKNESDIGWARLHVKIALHHGSYSDGETQDADLCKKCALKLLEDALTRVKKGERLSAGVEHPEMSKWEMR